MWYSHYNLYFSFMIDSISLFFLLLTSFLIPLRLLFSWKHFLYCYKELIFLITFIQFLLIIFFTVTDFIFFYICFDPNPKPQTPNPKPQTPNPFGLCPLKVIYREKSCLSSIR